MIDWYLVLHAGAVALAVSVLLRVSRPWGDRHNAIVAGGAAALAFWLGGWPWGAAGVLAGGLLGYAARRARVRRARR